MQVYTIHSIGQILYMYVQLRVPDFIGKKDWSLHTSAMLELGTEGPALGMHWNVYAYTYCTYLLVPAGYIHTAATCM